MVTVAQEIKRPVTSVNFSTALNDVFNVLKRYEVPNGIRR